MQSRCFIQQMWVGISMKQKPFNDIKLMFFYACQCMYMQTDTYRWSIRDRECAAYT
jgi:hypothetical protein